MSFVVRVIINAAAIWLATRLVPGLEVLGGQDTVTTVIVFLVVALVFVVVNTVIKPVVKAIALPLYIVTLGLFTFVVNALMLMLTGWVSEQSSYGLRVDGFWTALLGSIVISIVVFVLVAAIPAARKKD